MATRRSARLQNPPTQEPAAVEQDVPAKAVVGGRKKPKVPVGETEAKAAAPLEVAQRGKTKAGGRPTVSKGGASSAQRQSNSKISSLPPEVLTMILDNITDPSTTSALGRTSKVFYSHMMPRLYGRVAVAAMFHAHIPKLIRMLEPLLSIAQKKQLKKEGKYRGQQERFPTGLDEKAKPICAGYVRQFIIGVVDPGKKHIYIVHRYIEEALKNMENLEIVETRVLTKSIAESLTSMTNLKALSLLEGNFVAEVEDIRPLVRIKDLKHLYVQDFGNSAKSFEQPPITQFMLRNLTSTLQSLVIETTTYACQFLEDWEKNLNASAGANTTGICEKGHDFTALKSLALSGLLIDENFIKEFQNAFEFPRLRLLSLARLEDPKRLFYPCLSNLAISYQGTTDFPISLRNLSINMSDDEHKHNAVQRKALLEDKCRFISSFDTLTTLELSDYGRYPSNSISFVNPGLSETLLQAILKHKNLRVLRISYAGTTSGLEIPYLAANTVRSIVEGLPRLRELEFAPDENQLDEIGQALLCGSTHLESIICFPHSSWVNYPAPDNPGVNVVSSILSAFLSNSKINLMSTSTNKSFVWEDYYKLKRVSVTYKTWEIASEFGKRGKTGKGGKVATRPERMQMDAADGTREVLYRLVTIPVRIHVGYDPDFEWVSQVDREIQ